MNKYILIPSITLFSIIILTSTYFIYKHYIAKEPKHPPIKTIKIQYEQPEIIIGRHEPQSSFDFYLDTKHGYIANWFVQDDSKVHKTQPIFEYYNPIIEKKIAHKQQMLALLSHKEDIPSDDTRVIDLKNEIATLQQNLRTKITAPFAGILVIKSNTPSTANAPCATLYQPKYHITASIPETYISSLKIGQILKIRSANSNATTVEKITKISPFPTNYYTSDKLSRYEINLTSSTNARLGQHFELELPSKTIVIPKTALIDNKFVLLKKSNKFVKRVIKFRESGNYNRITVKSGLSPGEVIVQNAKSINHLK